MSESRLKMKPMYRLAAFSFVAILALACIGFLYLWNRNYKPQGPPEHILSQMDFEPVLIKQNSEKYIIDKNSFKFDPADKVLSYVIQNQQNKITITEQAYPEVIVFDKLVGSMGLYDEVQTKVGKASLTRPPNLKGKQVAVLNYQNSVLIFAQSESDLEKQKWRIIFEALESYD